MGDAVARLSMHDAGELLTLQRAAYVTEAQAHNDPALPPLVESLDELVRAVSSPGVSVFGIRDGTGRLVAAVRVHNRRGTCCEVGRLVVAPDRQGRGLGTRLLAYVEGVLACDVVEMTLFTGERSIGNLRLYRRLGFRETHRVPTGRGYSMIFFSKRLLRREGRVGDCPMPRASTE